MRTRHGTARYRAQSCPPSRHSPAGEHVQAFSHVRPPPTRSSPTLPTDRKSTRLNSSHLVISYAVFCLKKKKKNHKSSASVSITPTYRSLHTDTLYLCCSHV